MKRLQTTERVGWQARVEEIGLTYHTPNGQRYWNEGVYYEFTAQQIDQLEAATNALHKMCIDAAEHVIENGRMSELGIPDAAHQWIVESWNRDDFSLYGRFDFAYDGVNPPKMLEYNADTPTSLVEASVAQWQWLQDLFPKCDQFNSIHERLIEGWKRFNGLMGHKGIIHLGGVKDHLEDQQTVLYIQDTCHQAGNDTRNLPVEELGWHNQRQRFMDLDEEEVSYYFKLYPWEWMWNETFAQHLSKEAAIFIEPMWKMLLSNKGILPILWELNKDHENLLPAFFAPDQLKGDYVKKPKLSREGANVSLVRGGKTEVEVGGEYGEEGYIYQAVAHLPNFDGNYPVIGSWVVDHESAGIGIREDSTLITGNFSRFVPHLFK